MTMFILIVATLLATVNALVSGYYLTLAVDAAPEDPARRGHIIFASIAGVSCFFLFTIAAIQP
jgi:hypothetical protein